ncbi:hypothetical protein OS493_014073 [Desmophyllum pertusum]|uniref:Uncharacterized protein n=1 Tax=Desmophyllum pertusum TaxID=174260 RepID=A0A9W9ZET3_9CNID|nr:hypothetical protein OS493_014073 [Desmophyllum pertusum]
MAVVVDHQSSNMRSIKERSDEKLMSTDISRASDAFSGNHQLCRDHSDGETKVTQISQTKRKYGFVKEEAESASNSKRTFLDQSSLELPSHSQDELRKIYGERAQRTRVKLTFDSKDSDSSEEEEGISEEELKKTEGWKQLIKNLKAITADCQ